MITSARPRHGVVIPLYGVCPAGLGEQVRSYAQAGLEVLLVQNNPENTAVLPAGLQAVVEGQPRVSSIGNQNRGGVAGGFNRGIEAAIARGVEWITLLDQDSRLPVDQLVRLLEPWTVLPHPSLMVGPRIWDGRRSAMHGRRRQTKVHGYLQTRLLISSGTTFKAADWPDLGPMLEWLFVDFVDHVWSFHAQSMGFLLIQHPEVVLAQSFGHRHPNPVCRALGMELYSPMRHYYSIRNLRWLLSRQEVPMDLRLKELVKMLAKPWLWLLFEPRRRDNLQAICDGLRAPLCGHDQ